MSYTLYRPESIREAIALQQQTGGNYLAGGTISLVNYHRGVDIGASQISLDKIPELKKIVLKDGMLSVGAFVTMDELEQSGEVKKYAHALWQAASEIAGPQVRNRATLGGNIAAAAPSADCVPPLLAMGAVLQITGAAGRREIPVREFFLGRFQHVLTPDEIICMIRIPVQSSAKSVFRKVGKRSALAVSCVNMALVRSEAGVAVAVGAAAPVPIFCRKTSEILSADVKCVGEAAAVLQTEISPIDDRWATASFRRLVCENLLYALLDETEVCQ